MTQMKIAIFGDNGIGRFFAQLFDDVPDVTFYISERNRSGLNVTQRAQHRLSNNTQLRHVLQSPIKAFLRYRHNNYDNKLDFHYFELEEAVRQNLFDVAITAAERSLYTLSGLRQQYANFKLIYWTPFTIPFVDMFAARSFYIRQHSFPRVDRFIAITDTCAATHKFEGIPENKISQVYPGIDLAMFRPRAKEASRASGVNPDKFNILFVGKLASWKGCHTLIYATKLLAAEIPNIHVTFVGRGAQRDNLIKAAHLLGIAERITFADLVAYENIPLFYNAADIFVLPSLPAINLAEQFGYVVAEAMASGIPAVVSRVGGLPEVVGHDARLLFTPGDYRELANRILALHQDKNLYNEAARTCLERAVENFDARKNGQKLLAISKSVFSE
ncbi:MAG: glycosyltransferase family 4 protein [Gallionella sp.]|nr:glycosyltransferase family 4 protein [Gallionella sp.]